MLSRFWNGATCALALAVLIGCSPSQNESASSEGSSRLLTLTALGRIAPGRNETEFKQAIQKLSPDRLDEFLAHAKVNSVDELFISERDGQPYVIFYRGQRPRGVASDLFAYEQTGVDGKRLVAFGIGSIGEVDEQRFSELVPPASQPKK